MSDNRDRRYPQNLQGLLRLAAEITTDSSEGGRNAAASAANAPGFLSEERRRWFNEALASLSYDHISILDKNMNILADGIKERRRSDHAEDEQAIAVQENALDGVTELVDNLDFANDFQKIGGFNLLLPVLKTAGEDYAGLRWRLANLVAILVQNNPYCQNAVLTEKNGEVVKTLLILMDSDSDATVKVKCVHALSCLTRNNADAQTFFEANDGFSCLVKAIQSNVEKLRLKSCFFLSSYCNAKPAIIDNLFKMGFVELLVNLLHSEHSIVHEYLLSTLLFFVTNHEDSVKECLRRDLRLEEILNRKIVDLDGKDECQEEIEYSKKILEKCFPKVDNEMTER